MKDPAEPAKLEVSFSDGKQFSFRNESIYSRSLKFSCCCFDSRRSSRSVLGSVHRLRQLHADLRLHRIRPVPHGAVLDPEQEAHSAQRDHWGSAQHLVLHRCQRGQDGRHRSGRDVLQSHEPVRQSRVKKVSPWGASSCLKKCVFYVVVFYFVEIKFLILIFQKRYFLFIILVQWLHLTLSLNCKSYI